VNATVDVQMECETLADWPHFYSPLDCAAVAEQLAEGLAEAKSAYLAARFVHDHAGAEAALGEWRDLTWLLGSLADGLADQRSRFIASGRPWPLASLR
jgi:hypothetical protein